MNSRDIRYTVVITAHNEERHIRQTVVALSDQTDVEPRSLEILVIDDGSTDATVAQALAANSELLTVLSNQRDPTSELTTRQQALDYGFRQARGEIILTLDADGRPGRDWVSKMTGPIVDGRTDAVAGPVGFAPQPGWISAWQSCDASYYLLVSSILNRFGIAGGVFFGNFAFRTALYADVGGYRALGMALTEDLQFGRALHALGCKVHYGDRHCLVRYQPCKDFRSLIERTMRVSSGSFSAMTAVLTVVPLTLLVALIASIFSGGLLMLSALVVRYLLGVGVVTIAQFRLGKPSSLAAVLYYELVVFVLAPAVFGKVMSGDRVAWGDGLYDR